MPAVFLALSLRSGEVWLLPILGVYDVSEKLRFAGGLEVNSLTFTRTLGAFPSSCICHGHSR